MKDIYKLGTQVLTDENYEALRRLCRAIKSLHGWYVTRRVYLEQMEGNHDPNYLDSLHFALENLQKAQTEVEQATLAARDALLPLRGNSFIVPDEHGGCDWISVDPNGAHILLLKSGTFHVEYERGAE